MYLVSGVLFLQYIFAEYGLITSREWIKYSCKYNCSLDISYHIWLRVEIDLISQYSSCKGIVVEEGKGNHLEPMASEPTPPQLLMEMTHYRPQKQQSNDGANFDTNSANEQR